MKSYKLSAVKTLFTDKTAKSQLKKVIQEAGAGVKLLAKTAFRRHILRKPDTPSLAATVNKVKQSVGNAVAGLAMIASSVMFGNALLAASRNIVKTDQARNQTDLVLAKLLEQKLGMEVLEKPRHINDGVCAGFSLELSRQILVHETREGAISDPTAKFMQFAGNMAKGAPPAAHAHQAIYQSIQVDDVNSLKAHQSVIDTQLFAALDANNGKGIFKADPNNVLNAIARITGEPIDNYVNSPIATAVKACSKQIIYENNSFSRVGERFKESVLQKLNDADPKLTADQLEQAKNELEWVVGLLEMRSCLVHDPVLEGKRSRLFKNIKNEKLKKTPVLKKILNTSGTRDLYYKKISNPEMRTNLKFMFNRDCDQRNFAVVAKARGLSLTPMDQVVGHPLTNKSDTEVLDRMNQLPDGCYIMTIDIKGGEGHAMQFFKEGEKQFLFDPNFGVIDCSNDEHKKHIPTLLDQLYPPPEMSALRGAGTSHNIDFRRVEKKPDGTDLLSGVKPEQYMFNNKGEAVEKSTAMKTLNYRAAPVFSKALLKKIETNWINNGLKTLNPIDISMLINQFAAYGADGRDVNKDGKVLTPAEQKQAIMDALGDTADVSLKKEMLKALAQIENEQKKIAKSKERA